MTRAAQNRLRCAAPLLFALVTASAAAEQAPAAPSTTTSPSTSTSPSTGTSTATTPTPEARPLGIELHVDPEEVTLGQHITVRLSVDHDPRDVYTLPGFDPSPLAVPQGAPAPSQTREEVQGHARTTFTLVLADLSSLTPRIPDLVLHVTGPDGERTLTVRGRPLKFKSLVEQEHQGAPDKAHHGPKPPVPLFVRSYLWAWLLAALALAAALGYGLWRFLKREKAVAAQPVPEVPYDDRALQELERLRRQKPWERGAGRAAIFELSEIVRAYLGSRLGFNALDLTSEELLQELKGRRLIGLDLAALSEEMRWEDLVKFAKVEPTPEECVRGVDRAESIVRHTRPLRSLPKSEAA